MPTPPDAMTSSEVAASTSARPLEVGATHQALDRDLGDDHRLGAGVGQALQRVGPLDARRPRPSPRTATSRPRTSRPSATGCREAIVATRSGSSMAAVPITTRATPGVGQGAGRLGAAHSPARLHRHVDRRRDGGDEVAVHRLAGAGGVEVDGVDPAGAGRHERLGDRHRVVAVDPLAVEVALDELHDLPAAQVDGRVEVHQAAATGAAQRSTNAWSTGEAGAARLLRVELGGPHAVPARRRPPPGRRSRRWRSRWRRRCRRRRSARSRPTPDRARGAAARGRRGARAGSTASAGASRRRGGGGRCRGGRRGR